MKIIKNHWVKILSILFFILLFGSYAQIFAVFSPGQTLDPNCAPGSTGCIVESVPSQLGNANKYLTTDGTNMFWASTPVGVTASSSEVFTNKDLTSATNTFPTFNQNTTGTSAGLSSAYIDWNASSGGSSILNKPSIPSTLAALADDITHRLVSDAEKSTWNGKQNALVSGTNIKTINSTSLLGGGDISIASMTWPTGGAGIPNYSGSSSWGTSYTTNGSGTVIALATTPTFTTNITTPLVLGGSSTTSPLTFQTTSGVGTTGADMHFKVGNNGATEALTILNTGNVGIGTTSPNYKLDVQGKVNIGYPFAGGSDQLTIGGASTVGATIITNSNTGGQAYVNLSGGADITDGVVGTWGFTNYDSSWVSSQVAKVETRRGSGGAAEGYMTFFTKTQAGSIGERMRIDPSGKVGIGTTSPTASLHLKAGTATAGTAPLKLTAGTNLTTTEAGAIEYNGTHLYFTATNGGARYQLDQQSVGGGATWDTIGDPTGNGSIAMGSTVQTMDWATATTQNALGINATSLTTGRALSIDVGNNLTSGSGLYVEASGTSAISGGLIRIGHWGNYTSTTGLLNVAGDYTNTGIIASFSGGALTTGKVINIDAGDTLTTGSGLYVVSGSTGNISNGLVRITNWANYTAGKLLQVDGDATTAGTVANISGDSLTTGRALNIEAGGSLTSGNALRVYAYGTSAISGGLVNIFHSGNFTGTGGLLSVDGDSTTAGRLINVLAGSLTTGTALNINVGYDLTSGKGIMVQGAGTSAITGSLISAYHSGNFTGTGGLLSVDGDNTNTGRLINVLATSLTTGSALYINAGNTITTGSGISVNASGTSAITQGLVQISHLGNFTGSGGLLNVSGDNTQAGTVAAIYGSSLTTGTALYIDGGTSQTTGYSLWVDNGNVRFDGNVGIGTTTPSTALDVNGMLTVGTGTGITRTGSILLGDGYITKDYGQSWDFGGGIYTHGGGLGFDRNDIFFVKDSAGIDRDIFGARPATDPSTAFMTFLKSPDNDGDDGIQFRNYANSPLVTILNGGNVGIGTTSPTYKLQVGDASVSGIVARFQNSTGTCDINPTTSSLVCSSDINLKKNIKTLDDVEFNLQTVPDLTNKTTLEKISYLTPVTYNWKPESDIDAKHIGFIAQEMEQIFPDLVMTDSETRLKSVSYTSITPYLVKAMQEMNLRIKDLSSLDISSATSLGSLVKNFLGNIGNSIDIVFFGEVHTKKLCLDDLCITKDELKQILDHTNVSNLPPSAPDAPTTPSAPSSPITASSTDSASATSQSSSTSDASATPPSTPGATTTPSAPSSPITASSTDSASATSQSSSTSDASANPAATPSAPAVNSSTDSAPATSQSSATPDTNA